ncbi:MAG: VanZ family protein [Clostridiales bacterium]|nr:VanZ family protein [Clostridiales bacterium]
MSRANNKKRIRWPYLILSVVLWGFVVIWMWMIFSLSSESGFDSSDRSGIILQFLQTNFNLSVSHFFLRKAAHFVEFAVLTSFSFFAFLVTSKISEKNALVDMPLQEFMSSFLTYSMLSIWITVLYAVIDEYHQIFVFGRNASIVDVLIDIAGGVTVLLIYRLFVALMYLRKKRPADADLLSD